MSQVNVKLVSSPDMQRLYVNDNIKHEAEIIPYDVLFAIFDKEMKGTVNVTWQYEWTADLEEYDQDTEEVVVLNPTEAVITSTDLPEDVSDGQ
jgi:hypothetical protein